jgi:hypothetical protein
MKWFGYLNVVGLLTVLSTFSSFAGTEASKELPHQTTQKKRKRTVETFEPKSESTSGVNQTQNGIGRPIYTRFQMTASRLELGRHWVELNPVQKELVLAIKTLLELQLNHLKSLSIFAAEVSEKTLEQLEAKAQVWLSELAPQSNLERDWDLLWDSLNLKNSQSIIWVLTKLFDEVSISSSENQNKTIRHIYVTLDQILSLLNQKLQGSYDALSLTVKSQDWFSHLTPASNLDSILATLIEILNQTDANVQLLALEKLVDPESNLVHPPLDLPASEGSLSPQIDLEKLDSLLSDPNFLSELNQFQTPFNFESFDDSVSEKDSEKEPEPEKEPEKVDFSSILNSASIDPNIIHSALERSKSLRSASLTEEPSVPDMTFQSPEARINLELTQKAQEKLLYEIKELEVSHYLKNNIKLIFDRISRLTPDQFAMTKTSLQKMAQFNSIEASKFLTEVDFYFGTIRASDLQSFHYKNFVEKFNRSVQGVFAPESGK